MLKNIIEQELSKFLKESKLTNLSTQTKLQKRNALKYSQPLIVYRATSESGKNFYKGESPLPYTYYSLSKEKSTRYGKPEAFIFNRNSVPLKIFYGKDLFEKFGLGSSPENPTVYETLIKEGYIAVLLGDELIVYDNSIVSPITAYKR